MQVKINLSLSIAAIGAENQLKLQFCFGKIDTGALCMWPNSFCYALLPYFYSCYLY